MVGVIDEFVKKWYEEWVWGICMSETSRCSKTQAAQKSYR